MEMKMTRKWISNRSNPLFPITYPRNIDFLALTSSLDPWLDNVDEKKR